MRRVLTLLPLAAATLVLAAFTQPRQDGRFTNLDGSTPEGFRKLLRWKVWDRLAGRNQKTPDRAPIPTMAPDLALLARPPAVGEPARVTWLGHASFLVQLDGVSLLVDPALRPKLFGGIERNVPPGLAIEQLPPIDAVLVTHSHYDHLDLPTVEAVGAPVVAGLGLERWFRDRRLFATELGWWATTTVRGVKITFVPAQHWSARGLFDRNETLWGGFVIQGSAATVYHSGDTGYFDGFKEIGARFPAIDAALLPIGAYEPQWFMRRQHMNPEEAVRAFQDLGAHAMVAMHWGTFKLTDEALDEPPARLDAEARRLKLPITAVRIPAVGQTLTVGRAGALRASVRQPE